MDEETLKNRSVKNTSEKFERLRLLAKGSKELEEFVEAVDILRQEKPDFKREDIAYILNCSVYEVTKLQNKLRYKASKKKIERRIQAA